MVILVEGGQLQQYPGRSSFARHGTARLLRHRRALRVFFGESGASNKHHAPETSRYTAFLPQGGATAHVGTPWRPAPTRPPAALADGSLVYDKAPGCTAKAITIPQLKAIITARGSKPSGARAALVQVARLLTDTSDTAATTTHDVQDTMPTDPTRTKRGRTKKGEKDPPKKQKTGRPPAA